MAKLTWKDVKTMRLDKRRQKAIADDYGISFQMISKIKNNLNWVEEDKG